VANRLAIAGVFSLALAIVAALYLIGEVVFGSTLAAVIAALAGVGVAVFWFGLPLYAKMRAADPDETLQP
jgi:hypothetical protein